MRKAHLIQTLQNRYRIGFIQNRAHWVLIRNGMAAKGEPRIVEVCCPQFAERFFI